LPVHIPDGFLTNRIAVSLDVVSAAGILYAARRTKLDLSGRMVPVMGVLAAFVFAAQMLNFPILGGTSGHLIGGALLAILLGPMTGFLTIATVVIAQALFLQDGGLIALGANIFNISAVTSFSGYALYKCLGGEAARGKRMIFAGFLAGWASLMVSSLFCAIQLGLSGAIPLRIGLTTMLGYHAVVGMIEGTLTAGVLSFLLKVRPDLIRINEGGRFGLTDWVGALVFVGVPSAILVLAGSSSLPDPLEKLLALSPPAAERAGPEALFSTARYMEYLIRAGIFMVLIALGLFVSFLSHRRSHRP
jgi:cobalt/nickel transport system permease protein